MRASLTGDDLYSLIIMLRVVENKTVLLLEGESDCSALEGHLSADCESLPAHTKGAAIKAARLAHQQSVEGVVAIVDRDWIGILEEPPSEPNIFITDAYDLEATLFAIAPVRDRVFKAYAKRPPASGEPAIRLAVQAAAAVAALRLASMENRWELKVRDFPMARVMDLQQWQLTIRLMCETVLARSSSQLDVSTLYEEVEAIRLGMEDRVHLCSGHDLIAALAQVLRVAFHCSIKTGYLEVALRFAVTCTELANTQVFQDVREWGRSHGLEMWSCCSLAPG